MRLEGRRFDFYGEITNGYVDEIVFIDNNLPIDRKPSSQYLGDLSLPKTNRMIGASHFGADFHVVSALTPSGGDNRLSRLDGGVGQSAVIGFASGSRCHAISDQNIADASRRMPRHFKFVGDGGRPKSFRIEIENLGDENVPSIAPVSSDANGPEIFAQFVRIVSDSGCRLFKVGATLYEFRRVTNKFVRNFSGHVFTIETMTGYYGVSNAFVQAKNCRCYWVPVLAGFG